MTNTITINTDFLDSNFIEGIKKMFPHKTVDIIVQSSDETEYILNNSKFETELKNRISEFNQHKEVVILKSDELI